jgi:hypothetical protein
MAGEPPGRLPGRTETAIPRGGRYPAGQRGHQGCRVGGAEAGHRVPAGGRQVAGDTGVGLVVSGGHVVEVRAVVRAGCQLVQGRIDLAQAMAGDLAGDRGQPRELRGRAGRRYRPLRRGHYKRTSPTSLPDCPQVTTPNRISEPHRVRIAAVTRGETGPVLRPWYLISHLIEPVRSPDRNRRRAWRRTEWLVPRDL